MPETAEGIAARLEALFAPGYRENLVAKGLARGLIWRNGELPVDAPKFGETLSTDLLDHGFLLLSLSLRLRDLRGPESVVRQGLETAAEALESAARHDRSTEVERGFHLVMAAAAFHIGGFASRAYSLFEGELAGFNLASYERALVHLMRRDFNGLRATISDWLLDPANTDAGVTRRLRTEDEFTTEDVLATVLTRLFHRAVAVFEVGLLTGEERYFRLSMTRLREGGRDASEANHVPLWWSFNVARHLCDDLWGKSLRSLLPAAGGPNLWPVLREEFIQMLAAGPAAEIDLWPSQIDAARRVLDTSDNLVVALPTSAGKTRIAELCILRALADQKRVIYVTPLRALSAQIETSLARRFRPLGFTITSVYGASGVAQSDLETLKSADIVVSTPEKLDFSIRQEPSVIADVSLIVLDEGHMIGLSEREIRYEMLVQRLLRRGDSAGRRLVCLSAVFSEGDPFDDFTSWLRADAPGEAVRSAWRPTRQRPGLLVWNGRSGQLEFTVQQEKPFVPRFVETRVPTGGRRKGFPNTDQEFVVASTSSFLSRGQSVLIYCPQRSSVEATASAFLTANRQGYFPSVIAGEQAERVTDAIRIGNEWLGPGHVAVGCLRLGVAVHHGSLPRPFLFEVETLLRHRILPVCICSPTLAQGLDLCFGVLLFRSLYRRRNLIDAKEFGNVVGRVGRAFVDLDGLYVLPVFKSDWRRQASRISEFRRLSDQAQQRQLESGVRLLVGFIIDLLTSRLNCNSHQLREYVLNMASSWEVPAQDGDDLHKSLEVALNELDTAILGIVDTLEMSTGDVAAYLDSCLQNSYWQRRLRREPLELRNLQELVIKGRANWIWFRTDAQKRRAFFAAGIGYKAGASIDERLPEIEGHIRSAEEALAVGNLDVAAEQTVALARILYTIGPFVPENLIEGWETLLGQWLCGIALGKCTDNEGVGFIQQDVVYRLVWAVEASRLHLRHLSPTEEAAPGGTLALCLTYGVPNVTAAMFMQGGLRSRTLAVAAASKASFILENMSNLRWWVDSLRQGLIPSLQWDTAEEMEEWKHFLGGFEHGQIASWRTVDARLPVQWRRARAPRDNTLVRVSRKADRSRSIVFSVSFAEWGETTIPDDIVTNDFLAWVAEDGAVLRASFFGR